MQYTICCIYKLVLFQIPTEKALFVHLLKRLKAVLILFTKHFCRSYRQRPFFFSDSNDNSIKINSQGPR